MPSASDLPAGCPPEGNSPAEGVYYRLTAGDLQKGEQPPNSDWVLPVNKKKGDCAGRVDKCSCYAHSVFTSIDVLRRAREFSPWVRKKSIARVELSPSDGVVLETPSEIGEGHHDWWPSYDGSPISAVVVEAKL